MPTSQSWLSALMMDIHVRPHHNFTRVTSATPSCRRSEECSRTAHRGLAFTFVLTSSVARSGAEPHTGAQGPSNRTCVSLSLCITVTACLAPSVYMVCVCISLPLFTFSFVENTENLSETPAAPAPRPSTLPKPKPKPKPPKTPVPPKGAAAGASPKGDEVPPIKKNTKAPGKQAPTPPPKPTSRNTTREAGEYAPGGVEARVLGSGWG